MYFIMVTVALQPASPTTSSWDQINSHSGGALDRLKKHGLYKMSSVDG